jgi:hypothetical protein
MKVISLLQPWATLVVIGAKKFETRSWNTFYRGPVLIHASKRKDINARNLCIIEPFENYIKDFDALPFGAIIGSSRIAATASAPHVAGVLLQDGNTDELAFGDYGFGRRAWKLEDVVKFSIPIPAKGSLGLWDYDLPDHFHLPVAGGHATFPTPPTQETLFAVEKMAELAYKKLKK